MSRAVTLLVALVAACAGAPGPGAPLALRAQELPIEPGSMGRIVAKLVDAQSGAPVTEAFVEFTTLDRRALSDSTGTVVFRDLPPGPHEFVVRHIGYGEQTVQIEIQSMTSAVLGVRLDPRAVAVAPLEVLIEHRPRYLEEVGFYARQTAGIGNYFDPQFVERWNVGMWSRASDFLGLVEDMSMGGFAGHIGCNGPILYVDGRRDRNTSLAVMSTYTIGAVETYYSTFGAPDFALDPDAICGVIAVWTNRWRGRTRELGGGDVELCEPVVPETSTVEGIIRDEFTDVLLPGAHVLATLVPEADPDDARTREIISDPEARYRVCDVPPAHRLYLKPTIAGFEGPDVEVPIDGPLVAHDFTLRVAGPGQLVGRVLDRESGGPVSTARVTLRGTSLTVQTDEQGFFTVEEVLPGDQVLEVEHVGFEPVARLVSIVADRTVEARVELSADPIELEPLVVSVLWDRRLELRGFYERRRWGERTGSGSFIGAEEIDRWAPPATSSVLGRMPGVRLRCAGGRSCSVQPTRGTCSEMDVYINGARALGPGRPESISIDELVRPSEIAAMEVYPAGTSVPGEFLGSSSRCGAVVIWTR